MKKRWAVLLTAVMILGSFGNVRVYAEEKVGVGDTETAAESQAKNTEVGENTDSDTLDENETDPEEKNEIVTTEEKEEGIEQQADPGTISYTVHAQTYGWMEPVKNGALSGTVGEAKRLESIKISAAGNVQGSVFYRAYVEGKGWTEWQQDGAEAGTTGEARRLEAFQVKLTGELAEKYDVYYSSHAQTYGWLDWAKNGETSGTIGFDKRLECIKVVLVEKNGAAPGEIKEAKKVQDVLKYTAHVQTYGWMNPVQNGAFIGTVGKAKRIEALQISLESELEGTLQFRGYVQGKGWTDWVENFQTIGTTGEARRLEAVQIRLTGELAEKYDIYYRSHAQTYGWLGWAKNGETSGTTGYGKRLEALAICLVNKNGAAPGTTENAGYTLKGVRYEVYADGVGWKNAENGDMAGTTGEARRLEDLRVYVGDETYTGGISYSAYLQSYGWRPVAADGEDAGLAGSGKRLEAVRMNLTGELDAHYDLYYRVYVQSIGWLDWAKNGETAGTYNNAKRVEAIQIQLVERGGTAPGEVKQSAYTADLQIGTYVEGKGWMSAANRAVCGTRGESRRVESLKLSLSDERYSGSIRYQVYAQGTGWGDETEAGQEAGKAGSGKRLEAVKIWLTDEMAEYYHIYYRAYVQSYGWLGWASDGQAAGTSYRSKRLEAIEIQIVPKKIAFSYAVKNAYKGSGYGIDVSAYNNNIMWSSVAKEGIEFAMLRITTKNMQKDTSFEANYNGAISNGIAVGVYKYGYATTTEEARKEAQSVIQALNGRKLTFPVAYDVEDDVQAALGKEKLNQVIDAFRAEIEKAGYKFMLYTNPNWLNNILDASHFASTDIWIARYREFSLGYGYTGPGNVTIWQYTSKGVVPGIQGYVDRNIAYKMY